MSAEHGHHGPEPEISFIGILKQGLGGFGSLFEAVTRFPANVSQPLDIDPHRDAPKKKHGHGH